MLPAPAKWYDRRDFVCVEFFVADSKDVDVKIDKSKCHLSCLRGTDDVKTVNELELFEAIDESKSNHKRTDRSILFHLRKAQPGKAWPKLTKDAKPNWLGVDFCNWRDWDSDSDEETGNYDQFSDMMQGMGDENEFPPEVPEDDEDSADSDDEDLEPEEEQPTAGKIIEQQAEKGN
ncbi:prostaglandin E synthase 3b [Brachionichthys hirsutus]|uniref:prostaglandin E synthase 3b n=1 Tax=Brachionichthys hirsutus TaxID=412623 RepID=UPI003604E53A